ncbi:MAG: zinc-dependent alcohol dehydrogenase, partial [Blastocatellia bacterium]
GNVEVRQMPEPPCNDGQVKIEVAWCGVCGTDLHVLHDTFRNYPPVILGHEFAGVVVEAGKGVTRVKPGERVAVFPAMAVTCGKCIYCRMGNIMFCPDRRGMGHGVNGAFTKYAVVKPEQAYRLPDGFAPDGFAMDEAAVCEPFAACVQAVTELTGVRLGDVALVSGPGPIGLLCLKLLVAEGVKTIVAGTAADAVRLQKAREIGADAIVNVSDAGWLQKVLDETNGLGVDAAFECSGHPASVRNCLLAVRKLGSYTQVGICGREITVEFDQIFYKQLKVAGSVGYTAATWERVIRILEQGRVRLGDLISHRLPLGEWRQAFDLCERKEGLKVLISPEG